MTDAPMPNMLPEEIENRSFEIIDEELGQLALPEAHAPIVKRVIHTTADFDFARTMRFSDGAVPAALAALRSGTHIVTDTQMAMAGISKPRLAELGGEAHCLIADAEVARFARERGTTRSRVAVELAAERWPEAVYVVGNAPTALMRIFELAEEGLLRPALVVGVPVGFVNVVESKEMILRSSLPYIVARGRKGGSNVAAAICNALMKMA